MSPSATWHMVIGPHASLLFEDYLEKEQYQYLLGIFIHYCINQYSLLNLIYYILESLLSAEQMIPLPLEYFNPCNCTSFLQSNFPNKVSVPLMPLYSQLACEKLQTLLWSANLHAVQHIAINFIQFIHLTGLRATGAGQTGSCCHKSVQTGRRGHIL